MGVKRTIVVVAMFTAASFGLLAGVPTAAGQGSEQSYLSDLYTYVHPPVTDARLVDLGNLTCTVRRSGSSTDDAEMAVWQSLNQQGVVSSNAEIGTLVHVAIDNLCPEVGYP